MEAQEKTVREKLYSTKGASKIMYLGKWVKWINQLLREYRIEDPQLVLPITDPTDPNQISKLLLEYCSGLTDSECYQRIAMELHKYGYTRDLESNVKALVDEIENMEKESNELAYYMDIYDLPFEPPPDIVDQLKQLRENPEANGEHVFDIIYSYALELGYPEEEARKIGEKAKEIHEKIKYYKHDLHSIETVKMILPHVYFSKKSLDRMYRKLYTKNLKFKEKIMKTLGEVSHILATEESLANYGFKVQKAKKFSNPNEALNYLKQHFKLEIAPIGSPAIIVKFSDNKLVCKLREMKKLKTYVIEKCNQPILVYNKKGYKIYAEVILPSKQ